MGNHKSETMTKEEWEKRGKELFGEDIFKWKFICPSCGNVTTPEDFRAYKEKGATPDSAAKECIGRYAGCDMGKKNPKPCDWAAYGLFSGPNFIIDGDKKIPCFAFAPGGGGLNKE